MKKCVFAGTFDPFTVGHEDTVKKSLLLFDEVVVAVGENKRKNCFYSAQERAEMINAVYKCEPRVRVVVWEGIMVDLLEREGTPFYVRGIRNGDDYRYETDDLMASRDFMPSVVAVYLPSEREHAHISSTLVRNCIAFGKSFERYVPQAVYEYIGRK